MKNKLYQYFLFIMFSSFTLGILSAKQLDTVVLQLKWHPQFQFAGYYAAKEKGFYKNAGLNVIIKHWKPDINPIDEVVSGKANFGIAMSNLFLERQKGKPVVLLACIFQHSPVILIALKKSGIRSAHDLIGKRLKFKFNINPEIDAMLKDEGITIDKIKIVDAPWDINLLISGKVDAYAGYITDLPFMLKQRGLKYSIIRPVTYGIDFYGDCLFTSETEIKNHPERVKAFLKASIKGWKYAMKHPNEMIDLIINKYKSKLSKDILFYEYNQMHKLMLPDLIDIGHINPGRWKHIGDTFVKLGLLKPGYSLEGFIYKPYSEHQYKKIKRILWILSELLIGALIGILLLSIYNRKLNKDVREKTNQLIREKNFSDAIIEALPGHFFVYEDGERLIRWNKKLQQDSGLTDIELLNISPLWWLEGKEKEKIKEKIKIAFEKGHVECEAIIKLNRGNIPYFFSAVTTNIENKKFFIGIGLDLTDRKKLEEQLLQAQKMESIGRLAGGIAHDFNNILMIILGYSELLLLNLPDSESIKNEIKIIQDAAKRAKILTDQLLAFSRKQIIEKKTISVNSIIKELSDLLSKLLGENIQIISELNASNDTIEGDRGQIEQIIMNLAVNSKDAMPKGGKFVINTKNVEIDTLYSVDGREIPSGQYILISLTDSGEGMDPETLKHIFDPFFTTKERGKGTGLGLATVYGIIKQHEGYIHVYSELKKGTTFKIYFPLSQSQPNIQKEEEMKEYTSLRGNETILVVDDEPEIRKFIIYTLSKLGYTCIEAGSGEEAIAVTRNIKQQIDLLLSDVIMPGINGKELFNRLKETYPDIKVIFMSGYTDNIITKHGILDKKITFVPKPVSPATLAEKIRSVLDAPNSTGK